LRNASGYFLLHSRNEEWVKAGTYTHPRHTDVRHARARSTREQFYLLEAVVGQRHPLVAVLKHEHPAAAGAVVARLGHPERHPRLHAHLLRVARDRESAPQRTGEANGERKADKKCLHVGRATQQVELRRLRLGFGLDPGTISLNR